MSRRRPQRSQENDHDEYITPLRLQLELKAFRLEVRILVLLGLLVSKLHLPDTVTLGSVAGVVSVGALKSFLAR